MRAMVAQLKSDSEDLQQVNSPVKVFMGRQHRDVVGGLLINEGPDLGSDNLNDIFLQVIASVLRNLSWRADVNSKKTLREVGSVRALTGCALVVQKVNEELINSPS